MGIIRVLICLFLPPLAVLDKGCGIILLVFILTLFGWIPGVLAALIVCVQHPPTQQQQSRDSSLGIVAATVFLTLIVIGIVTLGAHQNSPSVANPSPSTPVASSAIATFNTPTPATSNAVISEQFLDTTESQREAIRRHPELGIAGSAFNKAFLAEVAQRKRANPGFFGSSDWPVRLADELTPKPSAPYNIVKRWVIPNGGEGKVIVILPALANEVGMTALAENLRQDTRSDRNAFIFIFDDSKAASMRDRLNGLLASEREFYQRHYVGTYMRNINSGFHEMEMFPTGMNGASKTLKF